MMRELLTVAVTLTPTSDRTTLEYFFDVPPGAAEVSIFMGYAPDAHPSREAALEIIRETRRKYGYPDALQDAQGDLPLKNLITLSVDDPAGYLGNAHRKQSPQWLRFDGHSAPPGFAVRAVMPGRWRLCAHIHALVSPVCELRCVVLGGSL